MASHQQYTNLQGGAEVFSPIILHHTQLEREHIQPIMEGGLIWTTFIIKRVWLKGSYHQI